MSPPPDELPSALDAFLAALWKDIEADGVRPLAEYVARFHADEQAMRREYRAALGQGRSQTGGRAGDRDTNRIAHYRIIRLVGRGGQGAVYLAEDTTLHRQVALKVLDRGHALDQTRLDRFRREAEITSKLDHPGICAVYDSGEDHGTLWIAMRYVPGESLATRISTAIGRAPTSEPSGPTGDSKQPQPAAAASPAPPARWSEIADMLRLFEQAARALHVAHEHGVIHRDVKPGNIMVDEDGNPVILDFGLAQETTGDQPSLTLTGDLMGTPAYMSPEQIAAQRIPLDRRTDVYSLAVSLFECLTLRRPFEAPTRAGLYEAIMTKGPADIRSLNPAVPNEIRIVLGTALEKDRDRRYQTAHEFADDLRRTANREPIAAQAPSKLRRVASWARRNRGLATSLAALFAVLLGGFLTVLVFYGKAEQALGDKDRALTDKDRALEDRERLADLKRASDLIDGIDALRPHWPEKVPGPTGMDGWLESARGLIARAAVDRARLEGILGKAALDAAVGTDSRPAEGSKAAWADVGHNLSWIDALGLEFLKKTRTVEMLAGRVEKYRAYALEVDQRSIRDHEADWDQVIRTVADRVDSPGYHGLPLTKQRGLIPLGRDPVSKLQEFAVYGTGDVPIRKPGDGTLELTDKMAVVVVLVPGDAFMMGSANDDPYHGGPHEAEHSVQLDPFFIGKFEVTQAQAATMSDGACRATHRPGPNSSITERNPAETLNWYEALGMCERLGLTLPTEAQWEYAGRGGTRSTWAYGPSRDDLKDAENILDVSGTQAMPQLEGPDTAPWDDGHGFHAPVGSFRPNGFGLYDMHGNVSEWCSDFFANIPLSRQDHRSGDGWVLVPPSLSENRAPRSARGGSFYLGYLRARSASRLRWEPSTRNQALGFRVARQVLR
jgi:serine/threonine protein kinase/formylglycine-generating enzyme required for sulfatase activity